MALHFGVFDHMDRGAGALADLYESRLRLTEAYDRAGFHIYLVAEHHMTPLGMAPSPSVFLSAVAQRTKRLRFGPLVYLLPLYHPLRLIEEICLLDHMSGGRQELGVGRGVSPIEVGFYGVDPANGPRQFPEALNVLKQGLTSDVLSFKGEFYECVDWTSNPKPKRPGGIPIWLGGESKGQIRRVGKYADGWLATPKALPSLKEDVQLARDSAEEAGRDPDALKIAMEGVGVLTPDNHEQAAEQLGKLKELGLFHVIILVHPMHMGQAAPILKAFGEKYLPALK